MVDIFYLYKVFMRMNEKRYTSDSCQSFDPMEDFCNWISDYFYDLPEYQNVVDAKGFGPQYYTMLDMLSVFIKKKLD